MLSFEKIRCVYDPSPYATIQDVFDPAFFEELVEQFPEPYYFRTAITEGTGKKFLIPPQEFKELVIRRKRQAPAWLQLYDYSQSESFIELVDRTLQKNNLCLNLLSPTSGRKAFVGMEVSIMTEGCLQRPHTDIPQKAATLLLPLHRRGEWAESSGGKTLFLRPKGVERAFNYIGSFADFEEMETVEAFPLLPNTGFLFPKTYNSWHAVEPVTAGNQTRRMLSLIIFW